MPSQADTPDTAKYQEWEQHAGPGMRARYTDFAPQAPLFEVRPDDVPVTLAGYRIQQTRPDVVTVSAPDGRSVAIRGLPAAALTSSLTLLDGRVPVLGLAQIPIPSSRWPIAAWQQLLQALLGTAIDLPAAFTTLSDAVTRTEIVRFPEQPAHAVLRNYWENAAAVRRHLPVFYQSLDSAEAFRAALAELHVLATLGRDRRSYYGGYGLIPTVPGGYREIGVQTAIPETLVRTLDHWSSILGTGPVSRDGELKTPRGQAMNIVHEGGTIVVHPATDGALFDLLDEARIALKSARDAGVAERVSDGLYDLAVFHQIFVNAHPFANINHSIAMNVVNACLRGWGLGHVPHLLLDYLAQRLPPDRFVVAFAETVKCHALPANDGAARARALANSSALYWRYRADRDAAAPRSEPETT